MNAPDPHVFSLDINDPEDAELIMYFLGELPKRVDSIQQAVSNDNLDELGRIAHQLKGAAPGFGFPQIGSAAAQLEGQIRDFDDSQDTIDTIRSQVEGLVMLCQSFITPNK